MHVMILPQLRCGAHAQDGGCGRVLFRLERMQQHAKVYYDYIALLSNIEESNACVYNYM